MGEPEALPDPTPAQLAEAARIDAGRVEGTTQATDVIEGEASGAEGGAETFPREYVEQLRRENADRRKRAEELEGRNAKLVAGLLRAEVVADGRLADPADLLDGADATALLNDEGAPDPEKVKAAVSELLARKPHYAKRISGDVGQGARPGPADPNEELWGIIQSRTARRVPENPRSGCRNSDGQYDSQARAKGRGCVLGATVEGWSPEGRMGDQLGPEYALLVPLHGATNPSGEAGAPQQPVISPAKKIRPGRCGATTLTSPTLCRFQLPVGKLAVA